jgi:hypothetical protein
MKNTQSRWCVAVMTVWVGCSAPSATAPVLPTAVVPADAAQPADADPLAEPIDLGDPWGEDRSTRSALERMMYFVQKMCACHTPACAQVVQTEMAAWSNDMAKKARPASSAPPPTEMQAPSEPLPSPAVMSRMKLIGQRYAECMTRAQEAR